jgi:ribonuclease J
MADVHVSGHACRDELRLMFSITKPKYFIPVHGEYRHLYQHARLAEEMGVQSENIFVAETGNVIEFSKKGAGIAGSVQSGSIMIDGLGIGDIGNVVLRDRKLLSQDGLFAVVIALDKETGKLVAGPEVESRGFVYVKDSDALINEAIELIREQAQKFEISHRSEWSSLKNNIRSTLKTYLYNKTKRTPMILPIIVEV